MKLPEPVGQPRALELGEGLLDDGMEAPVGLKFGQPQIAVGDEGVLRGVRRLDQATPEDLLPARRTRPSTSG